MNRVNLIRPRRVRPYIVQHVEIDWALPLALSKLGDARDLLRVARVPCPSGRMSLAVTRRDGTELSATERQRVRAYVARLR